jgi:pyridoxine/pyridoxamine 5'-phosphate oxidase
MFDWLCIGMAGHGRYTNYDSEKASDLLSNPKASLVFFWERLHRQVLCSAYVKK